MKQYHKQLMIALTYGISKVYFLPIRFSWNPEHVQHEQKQPEDKYRIVHFVYVYVRCLRPACACTST